MFLSRLSDQVSLAAGRWAGHCRGILPWAYFALVTHANFTLQVPPYG